jgi:CRISPR-associated protein Cas2
MWIVTLFDLPVLRKHQRKAAADYRKYLLQEGFQMAQLSVYFKYCRDKEKAQFIIERVARCVPDDGRVDILLITDRQYSNIVTVRGERRIQRENPSQLSLF